ncbi:hypothetical protein RB595_001156 [Gaeumannomyces hyphopodioides]
MSDPGRHRRSPTPYPSRDHGRRSQRQTNASRLLSRLMDNALHRCGLGRPEPACKDKEKAEDRRSSAGSVQPLREKPSHDAMATGCESSTADSQGRAAEGRFHRLIRRLVSRITGLTCAILDLGLRKPSLSRRRHRGRRRGPWRVFSFGQSSRKLRMRSVSPRKKDRYPRADSQDWNPPQPRKRSAQPDDASDRIRGRSHDSAPAHCRLQEDQRERLRAGLEELQADLGLTQATMRSKCGPHCPSTAAAMAKSAGQIDRLVDVASGAEERGLSARHDTAIDDGSGRQRGRQWGRSGSIKWDDRATISSSERR